METSQNNDLSQSHCHETALPERHSTASRCERNTVKSEIYKVEAETLKPAQECQIKNSSRFSFPLGFSSSWITEQGCKSQSTQCLFLSKIPNSFPLLPLYPFLTSPFPQASTVIMGFQKKLLDWELPLEILPSSERNAKTSSCSGRQTGQIWITLSNLTWQFYAEFKSRSKEALPFWGKSKGFIRVHMHTAIYTSTAVPSFTSPKESTHLLWDRLLELLESPKSLPAEWYREQVTGNREHSSFLMFLSENVTSLCLQKAAQALGGQLMRQAHAQPQQTRSTEHAMATIKAAELSTSMEGLCYISQLE